jgi:hypothetical protein
MWSLLTRSARIRNVIGLILAAANIVSEVADRAAETSGLRPGYLNIAVKQLAVLLLASCSTSPAQNMFGSFFPAWMLCAAGGLVIAVLLRQFLCAIGVNQYLIAPPLTYFSIAVAGTLLIWLLWYGH